MSQAKTLYQVQVLDLETGTKRTRLAEIIATLGADQEVQAAQARLDQVGGELATREARVTDLELELKSLNAKAQSNEKRLYSGSVSNPKELQDMQEELASLKRRRATLEDRLLEAMIGVEEQRSAHAQARTDLDQAKTLWAEAQGDLSREKMELEAKLEALAADRVVAWKALAVETRKRYKTLRPKMRGQPVAVLSQDGTCGYCGVGQSSAAVQQVRRDDGLVTCTGCGRILVAL